MHREDDPLDIHGSVRPAEIELAWPYEDLHGKKMVWRLLIAERYWKIPRR